MKPDIPTTVGFLAALLPVIALWVAAVLQRRSARRREKPPQEERLLRPPGYSLGLLLEETQERIQNDIFLASALCYMAGVCALSFGTILGANLPALWTSLAFVVFAGFALGGGVKSIQAYRRLRRARDIRLGLRGEQAVAEALHEVADSGYRIFHDLPAGENWNIDHVAVGPRGVFLVETKARRRRGSRKGQPEHVVTFDGKVLHFPCTYNREAIPQAERNACWLAEFVSKRTAEPVAVQPLVVLPGRDVETKGDFPVKVMNAKYLRGYLRSQTEKLADDQVRRIVAVLDEKCRDVEF